MARFVCFGFPVRGHTRPLLPVVAELVRRGVSVDFHATPPLRDLIEQAGATFVAYPPAAAALLGHAVDTGEHLARSLTATEAMLPALVAALDPPPDLVLFDASALWGGLIARGLGLPCVASISTFALSRAMLQLIGSPGPAAWGESARARLNAAHGTPFAHPLDVLVPVADLKLVYTARAFQPAGRFLDDSYLFLGPLVGASPTGETDAHLDDGRPLAYVSLGTIFNGDHALLRGIAAMLADRGWRVVVSLGDPAAPTAPVAWQPHVDAYPFVDQVALLDRAQLFVTHGGMNSVSEALSRGVPMIVIPHGVDQHLVARQAQIHGAAIVIARDALSDDTLGAAVSRIARDHSSFVAATAKLQQAFSTTTPLATAADRICALADVGHGHG